MYFLFVQDISGKAFSSSGDGKTGEICSASSAAKVFTYLQRGIKYFKRSLQNDVAFAQSAPLIIKLKLDFKNIIRDRQHGMTACPAYWPMGKNDVKQSLFEERNILYRADQSSQGRTKISCNGMASLTKQSRDLFHMYSLSPQLPQFSTVVRGHQSLVSLGRIPPAFPTCSLSFISAAFDQG